MLTPNDLPFTNPRRLRIYMNISKVGLASVLLGIARGYVSKAKYFFIFWNSKLQGYCKYWYCIVY